MPVERALLLLEAALPVESSAAAAGWTIGRRNAALFELRQRLFGETIECVVDCARCGEPLELTLDATELIALHDAGDRRDVRGASTSSGGGDRGANDIEGSDCAWIEVGANGQRVRARPPTSADVLAVTQLGGGGDALLERCLDRESQVELSTGMKEALASALSAADPLAELELNGECPACGEGWSAPFDIAAFLWTEVETSALGVLRDVHVLATAYGWSEAQILALSPARRAAYLELVGA